jgi:V8-like Glu-specific endopeptidase
MLMSTIGASDNHAARCRLACRLAGAALFSLPALGSVALAQNTQGIVAAANPEMRNSLARDPGGHWTPEELARARPRELPRPSAPATQIIRESARDGAAGQPNAGAATQGVVRLENGRLPSPEREVRPDLADQLFPPRSLTAQTSEPRDQPAEPAAGGASEVILENTGTEQAHFSSSRLVPTDARLQYPYRAVGKLFFEQPGAGNFICSAAVISPRLVLTAGHCVHSGTGGANGYFRRFLFAPAYENGQSPYQAWNYTWVVTTGSWAASNGAVPNQADFAILEMEDRRFGSEVRTIGSVTGWLGFRTNGLMPNHTKKIGYPAGFDNGEVMHQVDSGSHRAAEQSTVLYGSDMTGGSSGGPWIENFGIQAAGQTGGLNANPNRVVGVTSYGFRSTDPLVQGSSILNQEFLAILQAACAHRAGNC